ncbi:fatty-acid amide hydrolase 1 [Neosynchiropus ocellatus]
MRSRIRKYTFTRSRRGGHAVVLRKHRGASGEPVFCVIAIMDRVQELFSASELDIRAALRLLAGAFCGVGTLVVLVRRIKSQREIEKKVRSARDRRTRGLLRSEENVIRYKETHPNTDLVYILSLSLSELTERLQEGSLSPEDVFHAYMEKMLDVNRKTNCVTEVVVESFDQLKSLDPYKDGLLFGVPVSIKENIAIKDYDCTCGVMTNLGQPMAADGLLVEVLKRQGAIPFVKTNVPQSLLNYECSNPIFGITLNPVNPKKTCGGSSGGEGALVGGGGSVLGIGTDIGGSIRIPAAFCGLCGLKPTSGRLSLQGAVSLYRGQKSLLASAGPIAKDVDSLALCMKALLSDHMFDLDPTVPPMPFNEQIYQNGSRLRIGYLESDGYSQPSPSMARAVREVKALLEQAGHTLVPYTHLNLPEAFHNLMVKSIVADGAVSLRKSLQGSPLDPTLRPQVAPYFLPLWLRRIMAFFLKPVFPRAASFLKASIGTGSVEALWRLHGENEDYISNTIALWRRSNIDVLLCPMIGPAYNHMYCGRLTSVLSYTCIFNLLNFPAGVVPVTTVTAEDEEELRHFKGYSQDLYDKLFKEAVSGGVGLPVAVQCVALPWQEELCLRFMKEVEQLVKQRNK